MTLFTVLLSIVLVLSSLAVDVRDPCNPTVFSDRKKVIDVPKDCSNGSVIWQYPKSSIDLVFLPHGSKTTFEACIGHIVDKTIWEINEIINGKPEKLQFPKQDEEVCTKPTNSKAVIQVVGPENRTSYVGYIPYYVYDFER